MAALWYPFLDTAIIASATSFILFHMPTSLKNGYIAQKKYCIFWIRFCHLYLHMMHGRKLYAPLNGIATRASSVLFLTRTHI